MTEIPSPPTSAPDRKIFSDTLRNAAREEPKLRELPPKYAKIVRRLTTHFDSGLRRQVIKYIREWVTYAKKHNISETNLFSISYHIM